MILLVLSADEGVQKDLFLKQGYIPFYLPGAEEGGVHHFDLSKKEDRERIEIFVERGRRLLPLSAKERRWIREEGERGQKLAEMAEHVFLCRPEKILKIK